VSRSNILYLVVGALVVVIAIMGYQLYQDRQKPGLDIKIGPNGLSVDKK
jgi:predicted negative regulator of RcsB-dependent stress response